MFGLRRIMHLAVCFTQVDETYHHWRVFAPGPSGICIRFKRAELLGQLDDQSGIRMGAVSYLKLIAMRRRTPPFDDLPFLKRQAFANEREFRVIYESKRGHKEKLDIPIPLACIDKITLSPWLHPALFPNARSMLKSITGVRPIPIVHSTLVSSTQWKSLAEKVAKRGHNSRQVLSSQSSDSPTHSTSTLSAGA